MNPTCEPEVVVNPDRFLQDLSAVVINPDRFLKNLHSRRMKMRPRSHRPTRLCCAACIHGEHRKCGAGKCGCICFAEFKVLADVIYPST